MKKKQKKGNNNLGFKEIIKTLSHSIREYKKPSLLAPVFVAFEVVLECLIPWLMTLLLKEIENVSSGQNSHDFITKVFLGSNAKSLTLIIAVHGLVLLFCALLSLLFGVLAGTKCSIASNGFAKNLRKDMYYKIQNFSFSNIDKFSSSSLVTRMTTDVTNVQMAYMMIIRTAIRAPFMLVFALVMSFSINWQMALIFVGIAPILAIGLVLIISKALPLFNRIFHKYDDMNESVEENVRAMRVVKSYVREDYEKEKFEKASNEVRSNFERAEKLVALNAPLMNFAIYLGLILIYIIGSNLIINSNQKLLKLTELQSFMTYSFQILMSLMMVSVIMVMIIIAYAGAKRITEVLKEESSITSPENAVKEVKDGSIEFENVSFKYSENAERYALFGTDLSIKSGETVGIIGATGSSKSTLVQLIPRLYDVTEGSVKVGGVDVKDYDLETLRDNVAMVLQKNVLFSGTIKENLRWGKKDATDEEIENACKLAQASEFIESFPDKYETYIEQGGTNVSGGQKQRLCIARALLKTPKILILDDSTSAVDTKTDALIRKAFKEYIPDTTKIIIAQRISSVEDADKIIIMEGGKILAVGTHAELLKNNEIYQELYNSQKKGVSENA